MAHNVFISYSHKDKPIADAVCANLENAGMRCWIAPRDIGPGMDWPTAISNALSECQVMVLIFSAHSNASSDVGRELILAANNNLVIVPFRLEDIAPEPGKQYYLARTHWLDAMNPPTQEQIDSLVTSVRSFLVEKGVRLAATKETKKEINAEAKKPAPRKKDIKRDIKWIWFTLAGLLGIAALVSAVLFVPQLLSPAVPTPSPSPSLTLLPGSSPTPTIIISLPKWVTSFAQPILDYVENNQINGNGTTFGNDAWWWQKENFNDDECNVNNTYYFNIDFRDGDGIAYLNNGCRLDWAQQESDFLAEMSVKIDHPGTAWDFTFRESYTLTFSYEGQIKLSSSQGGNFIDVLVPDAYWNLDDFNSIQVLVRGGETAVIVNDTPVGYAQLEDGAHGGVGGWHTDDYDIIFDTILVDDLGDM